MCHKKLFWESKRGICPTEVHRTWMSRLQFKDAFVPQRCGSFIYSGVCWAHHNAALSHSKCFWMGICSLSHKMESRGGLGIWKGHIWGPPRWVFTFKDKWSHWVPVSCEWAPSAHTGFLNAHQNNLSKPRDTFHSRLMWGQIGNHFNKIPFGWNCISQKQALPTLGWNSGNTDGLNGLPEAFKEYFKRDLLRWQVFTARTCNRCVRAQRRASGNADVVVLLEDHADNSVTTECWIHPSNHQNDVQWRKN